MTLFVKRLRLIFVAVLALIFIGMQTVANASQNKITTTQKKFAMLEISVKGRLGVYAINTANNESIEYHSNQRFPLCSTNKLMGTAAILKKSETNTS